MTQVVPTSNSSNALVPLPRGASVASDLSSFAGGSDKTASTTPSVSGNKGLRRVKRRLLVLTIAPCIALFILAVLEFTTSVEIFEDGVVVSEHADLARILIENLEALLGEVHYLVDRFLARGNDTGLYFDEKVTQERVRSEHARDQLLSARTLHLHEMARDRLLISFASMTEMDEFRVALQQGSPFQILETVVLYKRVFAALLKVLAAATITLPSASEANLISQLFFIFEVEVSIHLCQTLTSLYLTVGSIGDELRELLSTLAHDLNTYSEVLEIHYPSPLGAYEPYTAFRTVPSYNEFQKMMSKVDQLANLSSTNVTKFTEHFDILNAMLDASRTSILRRVTNSADETVRSATARLTGIVALIVGAIIVLAIINSTLTRQISSPFKKLKLVKKNLKVRVISMANYQASMGRFVPIGMTRLLGKEDLSNINLGDFSLVPVTILFSDVVSFTTISEKMTSVETFRLLNDFYTQVHPSFILHGGTIDKFLGDGIMSIFETPPGAVMAGAILVDEAENITLQHNLVKKIGMSFRVGVGIHSGDVVLGAIGAPERMDISVISDAANVASRVEALTRQYQCNILMSANTQLRLGGVTAARLVGYAIPKGKSTKLELWESIHTNRDEDVEKRDSLDEWNELMQMWRAQPEDPQLRSLYTEFVAKYPLDSVAKVRLNLLTESCGFSVDFGSPTGTQPSEDRISDISRSKISSDIEVVKKEVLFSEIPAQLLPSKNPSPSSSLAQPIRPALAGKSRGSVDLGRSSSPTASVIIPSFPRGL